MRLRPVITATLAALHIHATIAMASQPIRILPLGDSITQADKNHNSYRRPLWASLNSAGYSVDFVGSLTTNYGGGPPDTDFDLDHEGHYGWRADELAANLDGWVSGYMPDVVLLHAGHNDMKESGTLAEVLQRTLNDYRDIIRCLRAQRLGHCHACESHPEPSGERQAPPRPEARRTQPAGRLVRRRGGNDPVAGFRGRPHSCIRSADSHRSRRGAPESRGRGGHGADLVHGAADPCLEHNRCCSAGIVRTGRVHVSSFFGKCQPVVLSVRKSRPEPACTERPHAVRDWWTALRHRSTSPAASACTGRVVPAATNGVPARLWLSPNHTTVRGPVAGRRPVMAGCSKECKKGCRASTTDSVMPAQTLS